MYRVRAQTDCEFCSSVSPPHRRSSLTHSVFALFFKFFAYSAFILSTVSSSRRKSMYTPDTLYAKSSGYGVIGIIPFAKFVFQKRVEKRDMGRDTASFRRFLALLWSLLPRIASRQGSFRAEFCPPIDRLCLED